ncbi:Guanylate cyclase soluble subunit beta-1 [Seminavis robusta]|uniref:Guanylate cyclase soluble subunit beta-1 n=1 Tax=Seminavis robusta TaxID=568900 RepID=A0A9N8E4U6_9STRA|nr:Guanylate cyclase soluble subunit beta-1 [Seminavis robusta]|eukprot:Sro669_g184550.1 Guanylate cyclase soluble subunit beta-1 (794) ;mRNA; r:25963-28677
MPSLASTTTPLDSTQESPSPEDGSVFLDESTHHASVNSKVDPNKQVQEVIGKKEDKAVFCLRLVVLLVLLGAAVGVSASVYKYLDKSEKTAFENQFDSDAAKVMEETGKTLDNTLGPADALVVNLVAHSRTLPKRLPNQTTAFPFVTLPSFGLQATKMLRNSKGFNLKMAPKLEQEQVPEWRKFVNETYKTWIEEGLAVAEKDPDYDGLIYRGYNNRTCPDLFTWGGQVVDLPRPDMGYYLPMALEYPVVTGAGRGAGCPYNFDLARSSMLMPQVINMMKTQRKAAMGPFLNVNFNRSDPAQEQQYLGLIAFYRTSLPKEEDPTEPISVIMLPIFDAVDTVYLNDSSHASPQDFVGYLGVDIQFKAWIRNILPENSNGIIVVVEQSCEAAVPFTYRIDGAQTTYLGTGDHHDPKYDNMVRSVVLQALTDPTLFDRGSSYTGVPLSTDFCTHTIKIYPSQDMEDNHRTNTPLYLTVVAAGIFVFTSLVFVFYDFLVERRQRKVMNRALASGAIVSSLFPQEVAQKLYEDNKAKFQKEEQQRNFKSGEVPQEGPHPLAKDTNQIAQLHPECTVFFADLAGFTAWSAKRQPTEVFQLLETLYGEFDKIADRRRVFKIETIGDCYVAITGCPKPQKDHAVIMCRFARDCMNRMSEVTAELSDSLGVETATLGFRVGLHSGPVTAGVLRGQKARFQLFGDTVNTAARMESNGVKGKIHVSQSTADSLIAQNKGDWLLERQDKITAKGKGVMTTYFVTPRSAGHLAESVVSHRDGFGHVGEEGENMKGKPEQYVNVMEV